MKAHRVFEKLAEVLQNITLKLGTQLYGKGAMTASAGAWDPLTPLRIVPRRNCRLIMMVERFLEGKS